MEPFFRLRPKKSHKDFFDLGQSSALSQIDLFGPDMFRPHLFRPMLWANVSAEGGAPNCGAPKVGPQRVGPQRVGAKNLALFFPSPATILILSSSFGGPCVEFWWCLKRLGPEMCTFGVLGLSCEAPAALGPPGLHTTARELQTCTFQGPKNTTKIQRKDTQERKKE